MDVQSINDLINWSTFLKSFLLSNTTNIYKIKVNFNFILHVGIHW